MKVFVMPLRNIMVRMVGIFLPQHREQHVIGVEIAGRLKEFVAVELHALTQGESPGFAVRRDAPFGRQRRNWRVFHRIEVYQAVIKHLRTGDERWARTGNLRVERFRRSFGAVDQRIVSRRPGAGRRKECAQRQRKQRFPCRHGYKPYEFVISALITAQEDSTGK